MKIFVLTLKRSSDRKKRMEQMFKKHGITDYIFIEGVDYRDFDSLEHSKEHAKSLGYTGVDKVAFTNLICPCMSQIAVMQQLSKLDDDYFLFLEDDIDLIYPIETILEVFEPARKLNPDAVYLASWNRPWEGTRLGETRLFKGENRIDTRSWANIYSPAFAGELAVQIAKTFHPLDTIAHYLPRINHYFVYPYMAIENEMCLHGILDDDSAVSYYLKKKYL